MAAGKKEDKDDKADQQVDAAAAEAKKKKKKLFMFIGIAVLLVLISVGATFFIVSKMMGSKHSGDEQEAAAESSEAAEVVAPAVYYPLKPNFTVNYDVNGRQRFLQAELTLMYRDPAVVKTLELHMPAVRNGLVMLLSSQVFEELQTAEGKEKLRAAALQTVQDIIAKEEAAGAEKAKESEEEEDEEKSAEKKSSPNIEQVLFTQFVMQ
ncbi:flagellar basal body-associated protein FliL [Cellvibrio zantedeschiae]|uniref:Flagellar protein FliL n=1 Tax=Cellvibrio zantedeschiae TaxID=1237077 RepID=A0ABQ3AYM3_9GAMM|nr:flagellar basal body-associated FliL family protein [Cellvibrio zantedeschiae]GGY68425.1 flagellar basal body-associated protein FliL [Cellvibrio zantedeschiae]